MIKSDEKADIRLVYLALHNIVKHRGNFLHQDNPALSAKNANMGDAVDELCRALEEWCEAHDIDCACDAAALEKALVDTSLRSAEKRERVEATLGVEKAYKKLAKAVSGAMVGYAAEFAHVFLTEAEGSKFALSNDEKVESYACPDEGTRPLRGAAGGVFVLRADGYFERGSGRNALVLQDGRVRALPQGA